MNNEPLIAVCSPDRCFDDDEIGACMKCACAVYIRPHTARRVPPEHRVCVHCFLALARGEASVDLFVSEETVAELQLIEACERFAARRGVLNVAESEIIAQARAAVATGATHDCGEWVTEHGTCALCDRRVGHA